VKTTADTCRPERLLAWEEKVADARDCANAPALRLLARLLVRAATAAQTAPAADPENQVDVAAPPKVGSDRR